MDFIRFHGKTTIIGPGSCWCCWLGHGALAQHLQTADSARAVFSATLSFLRLGGAPCGSFGLRKSRESPDELQDCQPSCSRAFNFFFWLWPWSSREYPCSFSCTNCAFANLLAVSRPSPCLVLKCWLYAHTVQRNFLHPSGSEYINNTTLGAKVCKSYLHSAIGSLGQHYFMLH